MLSIVLKGTASGVVQTVVNAPAQRVFGYVMDFTRHPEWMTWGSYTILEVAPASPGPVRLGSTFTMLVREVTLGYGTSVEERQYNVEVTDFVPNERLAWTNFDRHRFVIELEPSLRGIQVKFRHGWSAPFVSRLYYLLLLPAWPVIWPLIWLLERRNLGRLMAHIKQRVESER